MAERSRALQAAGIWAVAFALIALTAVSVVSALWVGGILDTYRDPDLITQAIIDYGIETGAHHAPLDPADPLLASRKIVITADINERTARDVVARLFHLAAIDPDTPIDLYVSTQGGWVDSAFTIIDAMRLIDPPVNTWAIGGCYSAGAMILSAGTGTRYSTDSAILMVHATMEDSEEPFSHGRIGLERYERLWHQTAALPEDWFPLLAESLYYLTPEEALEYGMIDEIVSSVAGPPRR